MGGMTVMAFADQFPEYVRERVAGVALISTSAGKLAAVPLGLPAVGARAFRALAPGVLRVMGRQAELVERGRRATAELFGGVIKRYSYGSKDVDPAVARFAERLIEATPIDVVAEFYPAFTEHEKSEKLAALAGPPALVLAAIAEHTSTIRLGTLVTAVPYRHPGVLIKSATTLDVLSGGRLIFGVGAGAPFDPEPMGPSTTFEAEGLGIPFPRLPRRFEQLEELLQIAHRMWSEDETPYR